jgi:uncharacterized membrane protein YphA (DoxX/SURF4 family)
MAEIMLEIGFYSRLISFFNMTTSFAITRLIKWYNHPYVLAGFTVAFLFGLNLFILIIHLSGRVSHLEKKIKELEVKALPIEEEILNNNRIINELNRLG